jgi:DNA invertase Pin-like site-specific DNA recombinase
MERNRRVVGLIRVSTAGQAAEGRAGIPRQRECIKRVVETQDLELIRVVELIDVSGSNTLNAPEIQAILRQIRDRKIDGVVVSDLDRLFRPTKISDFAILEAFDEARATVYSETGIYDFGSDEGTLLGLIKGLFGGIELRQIKRRMLGGREKKRQQGKLAGSDVILPTGVSYDWERECFHYNERIGAVIEAFRIVDQEGITNYAAISRRTGLKARTLFYLLRNPIFTGWRILDQKRGEDRYPAASGRLGDRKKVHRAPEEIIRVRVMETPAVTEDCWQRVQLRLADANSKWRRERTTAGIEINLGSGVARCAHCGNRMYATSGRRRDRRSIGYYQCSNNYYLKRRKGFGCPQPNLRKDYVHTLLRMFVGTHLRNRAVISAIAEGMCEKEEQAIPFDSAARLRELSKKEDRLLELYETADTSRVRKLDQRLGQIKTERQQLRERIKQVAITAVNDRTVQDRLRRLVRGCYAFSRLATEAERHSVLKALFNSIKFRGREIVAFSFAPTLSERVAENGIRMDTDSWRRRA